MMVWKPCLTTTLLICAGGGIWCAGPATAVVFNEDEPYAASNECPGYEGDADGSGQADVIDVQCALLVALYEATEVGAELPACVDEIRMHRCAYDLDCSGGTDVVDVSLFVQRALGMPLSPQLDSDGDGCHDQCAQGCPLVPLSVLEAVLEPQAGNIPPGAIGTANDFDVDPNADDEDQPLPPGTSLEWPGEPWLDTFIGNVVDSGGSVSLRYDVGAAQPVLNVVEPVKVDQVVSSEVATYAFVELGDLAVVVSDVPVVFPGADHVLVVGATPLEQVAVVATYAPVFDANGTPSGAALAAVGAVDSTDPFGTVLDVELVAPPDPQDNHHDCTADAWAAAGEVHGLVVHFPQLKGCDYDECVAVRAAWIRATHDVGRFVELLDFLHGEDEALRAWQWSQPGLDAQGHILGADTSPAHYFGSYSPKRFNAIRHAVHTLWDRFRHRKVIESSLKIDCSPIAVDLCFTANPIAHHAVVGKVVLCARWFDELGPERQARALVHELAHHLYVPFEYDNGTKALLPVKDTHTHFHVPSGGKWCLASETKKDYGYDNIRHLATYLGHNGKGCWHRNLALQNNDTYAFAINAIGGGVRLGTVYWWPAEFFPPDWNPQPNGSGYPEGCQGSGSTPPPVDPWGSYDPLGGCQKINTEWVCLPPSGGGGIPLGNFDISADCGLQP